ncbi:MAG: hypothetical protein J5746_03525 [Victivallales bacterium]|nr:hypothetical protein [Victivallales bacterium]
MSRSMFFLFLLVGTVFALDIVRNSVPCAEIVATTAEAKVAAVQLQHFIQCITSAKLDIVNEPGKKGLNQIFVGENSWTKKLGYALPDFSGSGYDILIAEKYAVLAGPCWNVEIIGVPESAVLSGVSDNGNMHAVSAFLESLGVRFYAPGDEGTIIPKMATIAPAAGRCTRNAAFSTREVLATSAFDAETQNWLRLLKCGGRTPAVLGHTLADLMRDGVRQPEWCAQETEGKLYDPIVPRYSHPDFQNACIQWARAFLDAHPQIKLLNLGGTEYGAYPIDWRDSPKYLTSGLPRKLAYANMIYDFHKAVAVELKKSHPAVDLQWYCPNSQELPEEVGDGALSGMAISCMDEMPAAYYAHSRNAGSYLGALPRWQAALKPRTKAIQQENWDAFDNEYAPRYMQLFMHSLQKVRMKQVPHFEGCSMRVAANGKISELPLMHLMLYVNSKLLWEPHLDMEALLDEYYRLWFGPAAREMREFHEYAERIWCRKDGRNTRTQIASLYSEDIPEYFRLLDRAREMAQPGTTYRRHIDEIASAMEKVRTLFEDRNPVGPWLEAEILPVDAKLDGNLAKCNYKWQEMKSVFGTQGKTQVRFGITEENRFLRVAVRCYEPKMDALRSNAKCADSDEILEDDHVEIMLSTPKCSWLKISVNSNGMVRDECFDSDLLNKNKKALLWTPGVDAVAKRYADRWELEVSIPVADFYRPGPTVDFSWGVNVLRYGGGKSSMAALMPDGNGIAFSKWRRLWRKWQDYDGMPMNSNCTVVTTYAPYPKPYLVPRAKARVDLAGEWDSPSWANVKPLKLISCQKRAGDKDVFLPDTQAKLQYDGQFLYVMFQVKDRYVLANAKNDQTDVCLDSCVELFLRPPETAQYYNFEMSCNGKMLLYEIINLNEGKLNAATSEELKSIERFHTVQGLVRREIQDPLTWRVCYKVPLDFFVRRAGIDPNLSGQEWTGNFFKCADRSTHYHWMCWNPTYTFHYPEGFGRIVFE